MRLKKEEINTIKNSIKHFDPNAKIFLFGSRTDDNKQGGDIDILIISKLLQKKDLRKVRRVFFDKFGEQKIDIVLDDGRLNNTFVKTIIDKAVKL